MCRNKIRHALVLSSDFLSLPVEEHAIYPDGYERDAEPLSHVQRHALLEGYLVGLEEFDEEAEKEYLRLVQPEVKSSSFRSPGQASIHYNKSRAYFDRWETNEIIKRKAIDMFILQHFCYLCIGNYK